MKTYICIMKSGDKLIIKAENMAQACELTGCISEVEQIFTVETYKKLKGEVDEQAN